MVMIADFGVFGGTSWRRYNSAKFAAEPFFLLLRKWLQDCDNTHGECRRRQSRIENFWPKRVIDVGDPRKLTLVEGQSGGDDYLVLSHCWGESTAEDKKRFCTTSENYAARKAGFSYDQLPKTFQDAVQITRALQKQYLWIDALCIIQEGPNCDWDSQAKAMADIFASAYCTIAASSARGWGDGFLKSESDHPDIRVQGTPSRPTCTCDFDKDVNEGPLLKRAWVLQERVLSRRIIHFTATHTYCECGDGVLCEQLTKLKPPYGKQYFFLDPDFPNRLEESGYIRTVEFVQYLFTKYSTSGLSYATDRDVAIYSLVDRMAQVLKTEVRYGIFRCFLGSLLLWKRDENMTSPISYTDRSVPSWSWMAYSEGIDFILDANSSCAIPRAVDLGFIKEGEALNVQVRKFGGNCRTEKKGEEYIMFGGTGEVGSLWFDVAEQVEFKHCVVVSMVQDDKEDARKTYHILVIRKKAGGEKENTGGEKENTKGEKEKENVVGETENAVGEGYERVGVGKVEAQYVSIGCDAGTLW
ncbi:Heterokaryon incompatibility protein (HET) domain containing protein [Rhypophila decipiens]